MEEDDPIVSRIPVYLTQSEQHKSINILQYPLRQSGRPYSSDTSSLKMSDTLRYKPKQKVIEIDFELSKNSHATFSVCTLGDH